MIGTAILLAASLLGLDAPPAIGPREFRAWFDAARDGTLVVPDEVARRARGFRYVFVGGFASEQLRGYFAQNVKDLRDLGVPRSAIHAVYPRSSETVEESAEAFRRRVFTIASAGPEPLVIVAHSRGACDALAFALTEPGFVRDHVAALFLIQGAFGGSALADYVAGQGHPIDEKMPERYRTFARIVGGLERELVRRGPHAGLPGLTRGEARPYWARMVARHADAIPVLAPKTFFIRSAIPSDQLGRFRKAIGWYVSTYDGPNDGIMTVDDQILPGLGTCLGVLDCGHGDLTCNLDSSPPAKKLRRALMPGIVMAVARPPAATRDDQIARTRGDVPR